MIGICIIFLTYLFTTGVFVATKISSVVPLPSFWLLAAQFSGISGLFFLSLTYLLATRLTILTKLVGGFDRLYKIHHHPRTKNNTRPDHPDECPDNRPYYRTRPLQSLHRDDRRSAL